jgi:hypothetical protein
MSANVIQSRVVALILILGFALSVAAQSPKKSLGWPSQIVLVRDELTPGGSLGHLLVNGKQIGVTLEPRGEKAQITLSRAHLHHSVADAKEDYAIVLDDLDDGDSGSKLQFHLGDADEKSEGCVLIGTQYEPNVVTEDVTTGAGKKLLHEINQEKAAGKHVEYEVEGNTLQLKSVKPVHSEEARGTLRRALYGANNPGEKDLLVNFDFQASDEYKAQVLGISESIARQLTIDEQQFVIKALEVGSAGNSTTVPGTTSDGSPGATTSTVPAARGPRSPAAGRDAKGSADTKLLPQKPGDEHNSIEQGFKRSAEPDQPTTLDNKPTPAAQETEKKKPPPD